MFLPLIFRHKPTEIDIFREPGVFPRPFDQTARWIYIKKQEE
jgi:hypothetical protein